MVRDMHAGAMIVYKQNMILDNPIGPPTLRRYIKASRRTRRSR